MSKVADATLDAFSGHRTASMLKRYDIIDVDDLRRAAERASNYQGERASVVPLRSDDGKTDRRRQSVFVAELRES